MGQREIKFRAYHKSIGRMFYSNSQEDALFWNGKIGDSVFEVFVHAFVSLFVHNKDGLLMQYTGLKDRNGKEIYEGDIVQPKHTTTYPYEVYWDDRDDAWRMRVNGEMQFDKTYSLMFAKFGEVIGNIYENREKVLDE